MSFSLASLKNTLDEVRVSVYPKNETERKVYDALSSKNWGASSTLLNEIAAETNDYEKYTIIIEIIWNSVETEGKSWKQIFKALTLIEFLVKNGSERFIEASRDKLFKIRRLQDYNFYEGSIDKGSGVREKAKQIVELLGSNEMIRTERDKARALRNKFGGVGSHDSRSSMSGGSSSYSGSGSDSNYSNSNNGSGGRYGGDSYSDNSKSYSDSHSTNRYGGGAYDSDRPPRYGDEAPSNDSSNNYHNNNNSTSGASRISRSINAEQDQDDEYRVPKHSPKAPSTTSNIATGGKLKVSIKKPTATTTTTTPAVVASVVQVNLIEDDLLSMHSPAPAAAVQPTAAATFDPFLMANTAAAAAPQASASFDPFGIAAAPVAPPTVYAAQPPQAPAAVFDPFSINQYTPSQQPVYSQVAMPLQATSFPVQQSMMQFQQPPLQQQQLLLQQQLQQQQQQPIYQTKQQQPTLAAQESDFGDFEAAKPKATSAAAAAAPAANKWGDISNLVDLGGIAKNNDHNKQQQQQDAASAAHRTSFAGLDGFSKTPQNMAASSTMMMGNAGSNNRMMGATGNNNGMMMMPNSSGSNSYGNNNNMMMMGAPAPRPPAMMMPNTGYNNNGMMMMGAAPIPQNNGMMMMGAAAGRGYPMQQQPLQQQQYPAMGGNNMMMMGGGFPQQPAPQQGYRPGQQQGGFGF